MSTLLASSTNITLKQSHFLIYQCIQNVIQTTTNNRHIRASFESTTCTCWRHWTSSSQDLSMNFTPNMSSVPWKETISVLRRRRSERMRSYCQCSVASLLNSFNCFSMHSTTVDSNTSATSSLAEFQVYWDIITGIDYQAIRLLNL